MFTRANSRSHIDNDQLSIQVARTLNQPLLATKLSIPPFRHSNVERPRLLDRLNGVLLHKLTVIAAPAGFGKTTLLVRWCQLSTHNGRQAEDEVFHLADGQTGDSPYIHLSWLSLDKGDNDPERFISYLAAALNGSVPQIDLEALAVSIRQMPQAMPPEAVLTAILNEISAFHYPIVLILDDFHQLESTLVFDLLRYVLDNLPRTLHLVIAARSLPPLELARLRAQGQLLELGPQDLSFDLAETEQFLQQETGKILSTAQIEALSKRTEGWPAGLQLAAQSLKSAENLPKAIASITGKDRFILDYLAEEVFSKQDPATQDFLVRTSILNQINSQLCSFVTGVSDSQNLIEQLEEKNVFIFPLDNERTWYRYHGLFAEFLRQRLEAEYPDEVTALNYRAASWWASQGLIFEAIEHSLAAGRFEMVLDLVNENALKMLARGEILSLVRWIEAVPEEIRSSHPGILLIYAWSLLISGRAIWIQIQPLLAEAGRLMEVDSDSVINILDENQDKAELQRSLCLFAQLEGFIARNAGEWHRSEALFRASAACAHDEPLIRSISTGGLGSLYLRAGKVKDAEEAFAEVTALADVIGSLYLRVFGITLQAQMQAEQGLLKRAADSFRLALNIASTHSRQPLPFSGQASVVLAEIIYEQNEIDQALQLVQEGIDRGLTIRDTDALIPGFLLLARIRNAQGHDAKSEEALLQSLLIGQEVSYPNCLEQSELWHNRFELSRRHPEPAMQWAVAFDRAKEYANSVNPVFGELELLLYCRVLAMKGAGAEAMALLDDVLSKAESDARLRQVIQILIGRALCLDDLGNDIEAVKSLSKALLLAEAEGYVRSFLDEGPTMARLLRSTAARGHSPEYVRRLLVAFGGERVTEHLKEPLSGREIEVLELVAEGMTNQEIAEQLFIAISTVKTHINHIYGKLDARTRIEAVARARDYHLID